MRFFCMFFLLFISFNSFCQQKVIISGQNNNLEISPLSSINQGVLIEPYNPATNRGISTGFYIRDSASWNFYTNAQKRLSVGGNGVISSTCPLLINTEINDYSSALRVNGVIKSDTAFYIQAVADSLSFISMHRNIKNEYEEVDDKVSPYTSTPTAWALNTNIPVFRIRHPVDILNHPETNTSIARDFLILPYQYGMAIEYNGIVEAWVGEWSIHKGVRYFDIEGKGNGWGGVLWVGDDIDGGGLRITARDNRSLGGNVNYAELSAEKFSGLPNGDLRLRLPSALNHFQFVYGERGSNNVIAKMKNDGLVIPRIPALLTAQQPEAGQIVFDSTEMQFMGYNGSVWINLSDNNAGSYNRSSNGIDIVYTIPHNLGVIPYYFNVLATSPASAGFSYVTADIDFLYVNYETPPPAGANTLSWNWSARK
jgi:hypothetical protein